MEIKSNQKLWVLIGLLILGAAVLFILHFQSQSYYSSAILKQMTDHHSMMEKMMNHHTHDLDKPVMTVMGGFPVMENLRAMNEMMGEMLLMMGKMEGMKDHQEKIQEIINRNKVIMVPEMPIEEQKPENPEADNLDKNQRQ